MSLDFYHTVGGRQFIDGTMRRIAKALEGIDESLKKMTADDEEDRCADLFEEADDLTRPPFNTIKLDEEINND